MRVAEATESTFVRTHVEDCEPTPRPEPVSLPRRGFLFLDDDARADVREALGAARYVVAALGAPAKNGLEEAFDDAVEHVLTMRGALPPTTDIEDCMALKVDDQLARTKALGARGLALVLPKLAEIADEDGLSTRDSEALRAWLDATQKAPVVLLADAADRSTKLLMPQTLGDVVDAPRSAKQPISPVLVKVAPPPTQVAVAAPPVAAARAPEPAPAAASATKAPAARRDEQVVKSAEWRGFAMDLDAARGPKPVAAIERLFATRYMPLVGALANGEVDGAVAAVVDEFRTSFERSYRDGYAALRVSGKRPPMVLDAPDIAARLARQNNARGVKLVLIDGMRFDLGERVAARMASSLSGRAVCIEKMTLWAALPAVTRTQMALLARGASGLREPGPEEGPDSTPDVARGRAAATLRRERIGSRELMKLDILETRLKLSGPSADERLEALSEEVTDIVLRYEATLPTRTLLCVFGDHGFRLPKAPDGVSTGPATQGGTTPEEVLVPMHAWLLGDVH